MGGDPLPSHTRSFFEHRYGHDFSSVRVHADPEAARHNEALEAHAFTYGNHVWLGARQPIAPTFVLAHELAHVIQQTQPRRAGAAAFSGAAWSIQRMPYWEPPLESGVACHFWREIEPFRTASRLTAVNERLARLQAAFQTRGGSA